MFTRTRKTNARAEFPPYGGGRKCLVIFSTNPLTLPMLSNASIDVNTIVREQNRVFRKEPFSRWSESFINGARANSPRKQTTAVILVVSRADLRNQQHTVGIEKIPIVYWTRGKISWKFIIDTGRVDWIFVHLHSAISVNSVTERHRICQFTRETIVSMTHT